MFGFTDRDERRPGYTNPLASEAPAAGSEEERDRFTRLQERLVLLFEDVFPYPRAPRTVVVVPSLSMDAEVLAKVAGVQHYEERMLFLLMLLRLPQTHLIYLSSTPIETAIIDYYLHLLPGIPGSHARRRLTMLSCHDASPIPLTQKILDRPRLVRRLRETIPDVRGAHMTCFNVTALERTLAVRLDVPIYGCDPAHYYPGTKSGSREVFRAVGVPPPDGFEHLRGEDDLVDGLVALKQRHPNLRRAVVKHEEGASGEGNAVFSYQGSPSGSALAGWVRAQMPRRLRFEATQETYDHYLAKLEEMGGIVECFIEGVEKRSPSMQGRITPLGDVELVSTHDQVLGGPTGQIFLGCTFPADEAYRLAIQDIGLEVGRALKERGALGRYGVDFISVPHEGGWRHYPIEINLRKGGTTHPFLMLQFLTDGIYDPQTGLYHTRQDQVRYYLASDNLRSPDYRGLTSEDLIDIVVENGLHFHGATQQGVVFHLMGALSEYGKLGVMCVAGSRLRAEALYHETVDVLNREARQQAEARGSVAAESEVVV